jgi:PilZ domain
MIEKLYSVEAPFAGADKRRAPRFRALLNASIVSRNRAAPLSCTVNQLSATGARLSIAATNPLPDEFDISIPQKNLARHARLVWRNGDQAGVDFSTAESERSDKDIETDEIRLELARLKAENERLRAQIDRLKQGY